MASWKLVSWLALGLLAACGSVQRSDGGVGLLDAGARVPTLSGMDQRKEPLTLAFPSDHLTVVYFYPKDATPGCTQEACAFRDVWSQYERANIRVLGVSSDDSESHREFAKTHQLPFPLIADEDGKWGQAFGVPSFLGMYSRITFLVGQDGRILRTYRDVDPGLHAKEILQDARAYIGEAKTETHPSGDGDGLLAPAPRLTKRNAVSVHFSLHIGTAKDSTTWLAAKLVPPPGSHLYWKHAGEGALPTRLDVSAPRGFEVGPVHYPGPSRSNGQGRVYFVYPGPVALLVPISVNDGAFGPDAKPVIEVTGSWLSCDERCVKEEVRQQITWNAAPPPWRELDDWLEQLPSNGANIGLRATLSPGATFAKLRVSPDYAVSDIFPEQDVPFDGQAASVRFAPYGLEFGPIHSPLPSQVVVRALGKDGVKRFFTVPLTVE
jgi:peroxiredoxin Q/BCP